MWQLGDFSRSRTGWAVTFALALFAPGVEAQTIADYSRAQRAMLETAMAQAAARSAGLGASAPASPGSATMASPAASLLAAPVAAASRMTLPAPSPAVQVSGVFSTSAGSLAEVVVDATAYLLRAGEGVPGTAWHVETVAIDRVVLSRQGRGTVADAEGSRRSFALPALR
jgi:hypothetical protein